MLTNVLLRGATLSGKFLLIFYLAANLSELIIGEYGLITSLLLILLSLVGIDFYTFSTREILQKELSIWFVVINQLLLTIVIYLIVLPFWSFISGFSGVSNNIYLLFGLIIIEHLGQEIFRILIVKHKQIQANIMLFLKSGLWCYVCVVYMWFEAATNAINLILHIWILFSVISLVYGVKEILKIESFCFLKAKFDYTWIIQGLKISFPFFIGTIFLKLINYFDKILIEKYSSIEMVGIYVFYFGIAMAVQGVIEVIINQKRYPVFIKLCAEKNEEFKRYFIKYFMEHFFVGGIFFILSLIGCLTLINFMDNHTYIKNFEVYILICSFLFLQNLSIPQHYILYANKKDRLILFSNIFSSLVFISVAIIFNHFIGDIVMGVLLGLNSSSVSVFIIKSFAVSENFNLKHLQKIID